MEMKATGRMTRRFVGEVIELNAGVLSPANIDITLRMTFSTLWTGLQRSEACSYIVGSSPGVCSIDIHTFPSGYTEPWCGVNGFIDRQGEIDRTTGGL